MSLSTVIQGLLVSQLPEYEISNEAIGYLSDFSGKVLNKLVKESAINNNSSISYPEVKVAITKVFPQSWAPLVFREVSNQVSHQQPDDKESMLKNEISDFELIDDGNLSPKVENKHAENLFLSADFIKSYLPASVAYRIDSHGCMYLSVSLETVLSKLIQHARGVLENHEDPFVITKEAIERAIYQDTSLTELSNAMSRCPEPSEVDEFEVVEDDEKVSELEFKSQVEEQVNEFIETEEPKYAAEEPAQVPELDTSSVEDDHEVPEPTVKEEATVPEEDEVPAIVPEVTTSDVEEDVPVGIQQPEEPLVAKESDISEPVDADTPSVSESETLLEPSAVELVNLDPSSAKLIKAKKPVTELYGKCCPYFDATSFAIHMLSSIVELFLLHLVSETCGIARPQRRAVKQHVREAFARLTSSQNEIPHSDDSSLFNECVDNSITIVSKQVEWDTDVKTYISDIIMYISSRVLLVAATHARTTGDWVINSNCIASAASHVVPAAPVNKLVKTLKETLEGEGPIITPPPAPRIRAAEMIYLTSLYKETPLQIDNQLLVVFMFLVSLSLHTLCCVK